MVENLDGTIVKKMKEWIEAGVWLFQTHFFWTTHYPMCHIRDVSPDLYQILSEKTTLVIFKGDLNYRKLIYDCEWYPSKATTSFHDAIGSIGTLPIVALRTSKADTVVGVQQEILDSVEKREQKERESLKQENGESSWPWLATGRYGLISFSHK